MIIGHNSYGDNQGFFLNSKTWDMSMSKFSKQVGPVNHWQNSFARHKNLTCFLTDDLKCLRFDHQDYEWSLIELADIQWNEGCSPQVVNDPRAFKAGAE